MLGNANILLSDVLCVETDNFVSLLKDLRVLVYNSSASPCKTLSRPLLESICVLPVNLSKKFDFIDID